MNYRKNILDILKRLNDIEKVSADVSNGKKSMTIYHENERSLDFHFKWVNNSHFVGYFQDDENKDSQAIISLWAPLDAIHFSAAYSLLIQIRAGRPSPLD